MDKTKGNFYLKLISQTPLKEEPFYYGFPNFILLKRILTKFYHVGIIDMYLILTIIEILDTKLLPFEFKILYILF